MKLFTTKKDFSIIKNFLLPLMVFFAAMLLLFYGFSNASSSTERERIDITYNSIRKAVINCYALEGFYPAQIVYLEEHYGVNIDYDKYVVVYDVIGSNIMPSFQVIPKGTGDEQW